MVHKKAGAKTEKPSSLVHTQRKEAQKTPVIKLVFRISLAKVLGIFARVTGRIQSTSARSLVETKDLNFARYLVSVFSYETFKKWDKNPNDAEILSDVSEIGYDFNNRYYEGNGYPIDLLW